LMTWPATGGLCAAASLVVLIAMLATAALAGAKGPVAVGLRAMVSPQGLMPDAAIGKCFYEPDEAEGALRTPSAHRRTVTFRVRIVCVR
jgi:hypothetical protein